METLINIHNARCKCVIENGEKLMAKVNLSNTVNNPNRVFYACGTGKKNNEGGCGFFEWQDEHGNPLKLKRKFEIYKKKAEEPQEHPVSSAPNIRSNEEATINLKLVLHRLESVEKVESTNKEKLEKIIDILNNLLEYINK